MGTLLIGSVCVVCSLWVFGCESDKTDDATTVPASDQTATNVEQVSVLDWGVSASASIDAVLYQGGGPTSYKGNKRNTLLTLTFQSKQKEIITGIHIAKVEMHYSDDTKVEDMPVDGFQLEASWDGSLTPQQSVTVTYSRNDQPTSDAALSGIFHAVILIEADGSNATVVTTAPAEASYIACYSQGNL
jgi:hypothetical protein